jgi:hypothetical protein
MCLDFAQITCRALEKMFHTDEPKRDDPMPLVVYFYENVDEYVKYSGTGTFRGPSKALGLTAGHYTPTENISRFYWPKRSDAVRQVRDTFVHELTHHWIERRNPRWSRAQLADMMRRTRVKGYWIVEGFAMFIEEGRYDTDRGVWSHFNPHAYTLDVVAGLKKEGTLIPWDRVYPLSQGEFHTELKKTFDYAKPETKWGFRPRRLSEILAFYQQAGATCHFLYWGEDGKYRERLLDYVTAFYTSQEKQTDIQTAFGLTPEELGAKVEVFAEKVMDGWRPPKEKAGG